MTHSYRWRPGLDSRLRKSLLWVQMEGKKLRIRQMKHAAEAAAGSRRRALLAQAKEWHVEAVERFQRRAAGATSAETGAETSSAFWRMVIHHPRSAKKNRADPGEVTGQDPPAFAVLPCHSVTSLELPEPHEGLCTLFLPL